MKVTLPSTPVSMFPLPGAFLFPHQVLPLHVFEPRYLALVEDLLDATGRFVIAATEARDEPDEAPPPVLPIAGYGEIVRHEKLSDGRYLIWVLGLCRVRVVELPSEHPYRLVRCLPFVEQQARGEEAAALTHELRTAAQERIKGELPLPPTTAPELLTDLLVQALEAPTDLLQRVFTEPSIPARARLVLRAAAAEHEADEGEGENPIAD